MTSLFSRLQKLNKEATPGPWWIPRHESDPNRWIAAGVVDVVPYDSGNVGKQDAELIVECRNSLPAVLNLIEAAQEALDETNVPGDAPVTEFIRRLSCVQNLLRDPVAVVSGQEEPT